ncbi:MAG: efflux RND transporter periplasmic adaptor subunit [Rhodothermales bacterium]|nr:efflux RND transporter periplasmic adaptor subunit [Rhodothermales bacterium]
MAEATYNREERLFEQGITSEQEYLEARQALAEAAIAMRSARQKLLALGFSETAITDLPSQGEHDLVHFELTSPIAGVVIERNVSQGESLSADWDAIVIANLSTVWVDLNVFQRDLESVREGQLVRFATTGDMLRGQGRIDFVRPIVGEDTRTAIARIVYENGSGDWKPGLFVDADIIVSTQAVAVLVPPSALTQLDGQTVVFVETERGFVPSQVVTGLEGVGGVEIVEGLAPGERFVSSGAFTVKAELEKGSQEGGHQH